MKQSFDAAVKQGFDAAVKRNFDAALKPSFDAPQTTRHTLDRHPLDPPGPHRAAPVLGRLVADGLLPRDWALDALMHAAARLRTPGACAVGLRCRLTWKLDDAAWAHGLLRERVARAVRRAVVAPVLARAPRAALLARADAADPDGVLRPRDRLALVETEVAWAIRTGAIRTGTVPVARQAVGRAGPSRVR